MIKLLINDKNTIELDLKDKITRDDYKKIEPQLEKLFQENGRRKFLFDLNEVESFSIGAIWEDMMFDLKNFKHIGTTAVVAKKGMLEVVTKVIDRLYPVKIQYFENKNEASKWLKRQAA